MSLNNKKLVSIITPLYNSEKYISDCIKSVLSQSYEYWEMIIVDDCSEDNSTDIVKSFSDDRIRLVKLNENSGAGIARNKAIELSNGAYIAFLDADDIWHHHKLEKQINFMEKEDIPFSFTSHYIFSSDINNPKSYTEALNRVNYNKMLKNNYIACLTVVYNAEILGKTYMPKYRKRQDWGLWLKLLKKTDYAISIKEPLAYYRIGNNSLSNNKVKLLRSNFQFYNSHLGFSFIRSIYLMINFIIHHFVYKINNNKPVPK